MASIPHNHGENLFINHPFPENPLWILFHGFYPPDEMLDIANLDWVERDCYQIQFMLERLQEKDGILVPDWWGKSPQEFREEILSSYSNGSASIESLAEAQLVTLEILLTLWLEDLDRRGLRYTYFD